MSSHVGLKSDASRLKSGILTPTSDGSLNSLNRVELRDAPLSSSGSRKRKHDESAHPMEELLKPTIVIKVDMLPGPYMARSVADRALVS